MNNLHARLLKFVFGLGLITAVMIVAWMVKPGAYRPMLVTNADAAYAITSFAVSHGTNHTFSRGIGMLGKYNSSLLAGGRLPRTQSRQWSFSTHRDTSVLWISFTHSNSSVGAAAPSVFGVLATPDRITENANGEFLLRMDDPEINLIEPATNNRGRLVQADDPMSQGFITAWTLPKRVTNYTGWLLHLVTRPEGKRMASFKL